MFSESSELYDLIYSFKDYAKESKEIYDVVRKYKPRASEVLDICCGTGEHHKYLKDVYTLTGLDINPNFIEMAKKKVPTASYEVGDMRDFDLAKKFDVILCLFSSIAYIKNYEELLTTLQTFRNHLQKDGLLIIEPWISPENWYTGKLHMLTYEKENIKICRMNQSGQEGQHSIINFHYLIGTEEEGVRHFEERHELLLLTVEQMKEAFKMTGFVVDHDPKGLNSRGMYYAQLE